MSEWILSSSLLILVIILLRTLLRGKISARVQYALWAVVFVRLLIPAQLFASPISIESISPNLTDSLESIDFYGGPSEVLDVPEDVLETVREHVQTDTVIDREQVSRTVLGRTINSYMGCQVLEEDGIVAYPFYMNLKQVLTLLWWLGAVLFTAVIVLCNFRFGQRLRRCRQAVSISNASLPVYLAEGLPSPCLFGIFRPGIYLTQASAADPIVLHHVLIHEQTHYRHKDNIWSLLRSVALVLHWYNPLVWWAVILSKRDGELACDEAVLKALGEGEHIAYGRTLLSLLTAKPGSADLLTCATTMNAGTRDLRERISRISKRPKRFLWALLVVLLAVAGTVVFTFSRSQSGPVWQEVTVMDGLPYGRMAEGEAWTQLSDITIDPPRDWTALPGMGLAGRELATYLEIYEGQEVWGRMVDTRYGWLVTSLGHGVGNADTYAYRTTDGGKTWQEVTVPEEPNWYPAAVGFVASDRLIIAYQLFYDSPAYLTRDGGETWERITLLDTTGMQASRFTVEGDSVTMHLVYGYTMEGWALQSEDRGDTWELVSTASQYDAEDFPILSDLDHDGEDEEIHLEDTYGDGSLWILSVQRGGEILWSETGSDAHGGWNTVVLLTINGLDYLMRYQPVMYQGNASYSYQIFHLNEQGGEEFYRQDTVDFSINFDPSLQESNAFHPIAIAYFLEEVNTYLGAGTVLLNTNPDLTVEGRGYLQDTLSWMVTDGVFTRDSNQSLYRNLLDYMVAKEGREALTAQQVMAGITASDITHINYGDNTTPEALALELRKAATHVEEGGLDSLAWASEDALYFPIWTMAVELAVPDGFGALLLQAGLSDSLVEVTYVANGRGDIRNSVVVNSYGLHTIVSQIYDREQTVDQEALDRYSRYLNRRMAHTLTSLQEIDRTASHTAGYYNYDVTEFTQVGVYDDAVEGMTVEVYAFDYAIAMERPEYMFWVGGNYMDSAHRMRGYSIDTYFAAYYQNGELEATRFLGYDLFFGEDAAEGISRAKDTLADALRSSGEE